MRVASTFTPTVEVTIGNLEVDRCRVVFLVQTRPTVFNRAIRMTTIVVEVIAVIASFPVGYQTVAASHRDNRTRPDDDVRFFLASRTTPITRNGVSVIAPLASLFAV
jgi:hypothetical protein